MNSLYLFRSTYQKRWLRKCVTYYYIFTLYTKVWYLKSICSNVQKNKWTFVWHDSSIIYSFGLSSAPHQIIFPFSLYTLPCSAYSITKIIYKKKRVKRWLFFYNHYHTTVVSWSHHYLFLNSYINMTKKIKMYPSILFLLFI